MPSFRTLEGEVKTDVLIIGGGIAGILTAHFLHSRGVQYILVEKGRICSGTTQNTTAKITSQHGLIYSKLVKKYGAEKAAMYYRANEEALDEYKRLCLGIDCDFEIKDNYVYSVFDREIPEQEMSALKKIGCKAMFVDSLPLPIDIAGAVRFSNQAQFHPLKFLGAVAKNLNIYENTFVREMKGNTAVTDKAVICAENVIVATHFPFINKHGLYSLKLYQHRSYVLALENAQQLDGMYVDEDKKGLSFRTHGDLMLLGGGSHRTGKKGGNWAELRRFAAEHYKSSAQVAHWAAQDCMSLDEVPYIGSYSANTHRLFVASGFNKWGITGAMAAAKLLCDCIMDNKNDYLQLFAPDRNISAFQLLANTVESAIGFVGFTGRRCPHLGCSLKWNRAEHSWDCPCHGSRFDEKGTLLDNPANGNLKIKPKKW
ncbi:MAG: FAD-dependent oxidoreductase [Clostridia bacterium]|nr:FAD-dependent oxidoreductase [Clostridia bacterium]